MADYVSLAEVQQWLETTKLRLPSVDPDLELSARDIVFSAVNLLYDTSTWTDKTSTPSLIRKAISMYMAAWIYDRAYSEDDGSASAYSQRLITQAQMLVQGVVTGTLDLAEVAGPPTTHGGPEYFPNENTGAQDVVDALGNIVSFAGTEGEDIKFRMGSVF